MKFERYFPKKYNGEYMGGYVNCNPVIPNRYIYHWFGWVHYFVCYCGGKQFTYIKDDHNELTDGGGTWAGFDPFGARWGA